MGDAAETHEIERGLVLVVDDNVDLLVLLRRALSRRGYQVVTAENGKEALAVLNQKQPHLILLDMRMPVMDGWAFAKEFREQYGRSIPIVVMTAAEDSRLRAEEVGADSYIGKPFDLSKLYEVVEDTALESS